MRQALNDVIVQFVMVVKLAHFGPHWEFGRVLEMIYFKEQMMDVHLGLTVL